MEVFAKVNFLFISVAFIAYVIIFPPSNIVITVMLITYLVSWTLFQVMRWVAEQTQDDDLDNF